MLSLDQLHAAETFFHEKIPLTRTMGVRVVTAGEGDFAVEAPVALNYNHLHTGFGGSINAIATLAGYGFLWMALDDPALELVVAESSIRYLAPVQEVIRATCLRPPPDVLREFKAAVRSKSRARMALRVQVREEDRLAAEFRGTFVAWRAIPPRA